MRRPNVFVVESKWRFGMYSAGYQAEARMIKNDLLIGYLWERVRQLGHIRLILGKLICRTVTTKDDVLGHHCY
jgi:hypothetical protein